MVRLAAMLVLLGLGGWVDAHSTSTSYLVVEEGSVTWDIAAGDVHWALGLDADGDGEITWGEVEQRRAEIGALASEHLKITRGNEPCRVEHPDLMLAEHGGEPHLSLRWRTQCAQSSGTLAVSATLFFDQNATQRTLIDVATAAGPFTSVLSRENRTWIEPAAPSVLVTFATFVGQGLWHVWIGYDHLAFLLLLLLPGVLRATRAGWRGTGSVREIAADLLRLITAFTLAHSITLALAATETVQVPVRPIEIAIALSIVVAGLLNLLPAPARSRVSLAFGFGLIHGFGFANALAELGTRGARLIPALAGFNVGVELAQIAVVTLVLPLLLRARHTSFYAGRFMPAASLAAAMAGAAWLAARVS